MIEITHGNILRSDAEAFVNPVNVVGVMGRGLALQVKKMYPEVFSEYSDWCQNGWMKPGKVQVVHLGRLGNPRYVINFPTKRHWRDPSQIQDIDTGLRSLIQTIQLLQIKSISVPPLGCGEGGLDWTVVKPKIEQAFSELPDIHVLLFAPWPHL